MLLFGVPSWQGWGAAKAGSKPGWETPAKWGSGVPVSQHPRYILQRRWWDVGRSFLLQGLLPPALLDLFTL